MSKHFEEMQVISGVMGGSAEELQTVVETLREWDHNTLADSSLVSHVNTLLGQRSTRTKGLLLLSSILGSSSDQQLLDKASSCIPLCLAALKSPAEQSLGFSVTRQFIERLSSVHELEKNAVVTYIPDIIRSLTPCSAPAQIYALGMLVMLLRKYPKACGVHKNNIEKFLIPFLDIRNNDLIIQVAKCAHLLQQIRGGGEQGTNHKTAWVNHYNLVMKCISKTVSMIYTSQDHDLESDQEVSSSSNVGPLQVCLESVHILDMPSDAQQCNPVILKALHLSTRLENLFVLLQAMIVEPFPVTKKINCRHLLDILMKCLSAVCGTPCASMTEPLFHSSIMNTLRALCISLKGNILPYTSLLIRMILQTLEWSKMNDQEFSKQKKPFVNARRAAYHCLSSLLKCVHSCKPPALQGDLNVEDNLIANILEDISPKINVIQLTMTNTGGPKPMNKKARKKIAMSVNAQGLLDTSGDMNKRSTWCSSNIELTLVATECLRNVYMCMGNFLKPNSHKVAQETVVRLLYDKDTPLEVKIKLSLVMSSMVNFTSSTQPSAITHCIHLYSRMQHSPLQELSWISQVALRSHMSSLKGHTPPLQFLPTNNTSVHQPNRLHASVMPEAINGASHILSTREDVIDVNELDSSSEGSSDVITVSETLNEKRQHPSNETFTNIPTAKRAKMVIDNEDPVEISDSEKSGDENLSTCVSEDNATASDKPEQDKMDGAPSGEEIACNEEVIDNCRDVDSELLKISEGSSGDTCVQKTSHPCYSDQTAVASTELPTRMENGNVKHPSNEGECKHDAITNDSNMVSQEEMLRAFVDVVNEE